MKYSKKAQEYIATKLSKLKSEGYEDPKQRVAIAMSMARDKGLKVPEKKERFKKLKAKMGKK